MRSPIVVLLVLASTGCPKQAPSHGPAVTPAAPVAVAPTTPSNAGPAAAPGSPGAEWPATVEVKMITEQKPASRTLNLDTSLPKFRTKPAARAGELNALFADLAKVDPAIKGHVGMYYAHCEAQLVSRFAVIVECDEMRDYRTRADHEAATGGSPAGPEPVLVAIWLQPGLPKLELDQLAPGINAAAVISKALQAAPADCRLADCEYKPTSFSLDTDGIVFRPTAFCAPECIEEHQPRIPLSALKPTHPWGRLLLDWVRQRAAAGEVLVDP